MNSLWLEGMQGKLFMPIRHKEGRMIPGDFKLNNTLTYQDDINGSSEQTAGVTNQSGNILGLMPHPEIAIYPEQLPDQIDYANKNLQLFSNAVSYCERNFR